MEAVRTLPDVPCRGSAFAKASADRQWESAREEKSLDRRRCRGAFSTIGAPSSCYAEHRRSKDARWRQWRREWDSNPRTVARRRFSRPVLSSTQPSLRSICFVNHCRPQPDLRYRSRFSAVVLSSQVSTRKHCHGIPFLVERTLPSLCCFSRLSGSSDDPM